MSQNKQTAKPAKCGTFAPILEEDQYDNVIINTSEEDSKQGTSGPSYLDALKFASVYNKTVE